MANIKVKLPSGELVPMKVPDDWDEDKVQEEIHKQFGMEPKSPEMEEEPKERTGLLGVASDVGHGLSNALRFGLQVPSKLSRSGKYIEENPASSIFHNIGQLGAEATDIAKETINTPYNLTNYLLRKHLHPAQLLTGSENNELPEAKSAADIGKGLPSKMLGQLSNALIKSVAQNLPHIGDTGVEKALGLEPDKAKADELIRAIPDIATALKVGKAVTQTVASKVAKPFKAPDLKQSIRDTQAKVNIADENLAKAFDRVESEVQKRDIGNIPVQPEIITNAQKFLDKSPESRKLIKRAKTGDYKALRELQADLRKIGETALSNKLTTERKVGREALSTRKQINDSIQSHFENTGHKDLAEVLNKTKQGYSDLQKTYFSTPALAKVFGKSQKVPKNPKTLLTEESTEMNRFMSAHPEVKSALEKALKHEGRMKALKWVGGILGIGSTAELVRELRGK